LKTDLLDHISTSYSKREFVGLKDLLQSMEMFESHFAYEWTIKLEVNLHGLSRPLSSPLFRAVQKAAFEAICVRHHSGPGDTHLWVLMSELVGPSKHVKRSGIIEVTQPNGG